MKSVKNIFYILLCAMSLIIVNNAHAQKLTAPLSAGVDKAVIDLVYPVGSIFLDGNGSLTPPDQGIDGIEWVEQKNAGGHILVGASQDGAWVVAPGAVAGTLQTTDGHSLTANENGPHTHYGVFSKSVPAGSSPTRPTPTRTLIDTFGHNGNQNVMDSDPSTANVSPTSSSGLGTPHNHTLTALKRFGVKIWKRVS